MSWASATSPSSANVRPRADGGDSERGRDRSVDAVGAAVCEHTRGRGEHRPEGLELAHRQRRGHQERGVGGERVGERADDVGLAEPVAEDRADRGGRAGVGLTPARQPGRLRGSRRLKASRIAAQHGVDDAGRVLPAAVRVDEDLARLRVTGEPLAQRLGGREVADADDELGRRVLAQQQVVVGDRGRAAARAGERVGEQRVAGVRGERGDRRGQPGVVAARDDHASERPLDQLGERDRRAARIADAHPRPAAGTAPLRRSDRTVGHERLAQGPVEMHGAGTARVAGDGVRAGGQRANPVLVAGRRDRRPRRTTARHRRRS